MSNFMLFGKSNCEWCDRAKALIVEKGDEYYYVDIETEDGFKYFRQEYPTAKTVPQIISVTDDEDIGGYADLMQWYGHGSSDIR